MKNRILKVSTLDIFVLVRLLIRFLIAILNHIANCFITFDALPIHLERTDLIKFFRLNFMITMDQP